MTASMWWLLKLLISKSVSLVHRRARPPLRPWQGTKSPFANPTLSLILSIRFFLTLVSERKTNLGAQYCTRLCSARTDWGFPSPRQFQPREFMAPGGAALQPPPIIQNLQECHEHHLRTPHTFFSWESFLLLLLKGAEQVNVLSLILGCKLVSLYFWPALFP